MAGADQLDRGYSSDDWEEGDGSSTPRECSEIVFPDDGGSALELVGAQRP